MSLPGLLAQFVNSRTPVACGVNWPMDFGTGTIPAEARKVNKFSNERI